MSAPGNGQKKCDLTPVSLWAGEELPQEWEGEAKKKERGG
jgi:hypothetical protein